jgi:hypothetical protein
MIDKKIRQRTARPRYCHAFDRTARVPVSRFERASACVRACARARVRACARAQASFLVPSNYISLFTFVQNTRALTYLNIHAV